MDTELFRVVVKPTGDIAIKFSDNIKSSIPAEKLEKLLKNDVEEHLYPIVSKILNETV